MTATNITRISNFKAYVFIAIEHFKNSYFCLLNYSIMFNIQYYKNNFEFKLSIKNVIQINENIRRML